MRPSELGAIADEALQRCTHAEGGTLCRTCLVAVLGYVGGVSPGEAPGEASGEPEGAAQRGGEVASPEPASRWEQPEFTVLVRSVR